MTFDDALKLIKNRYPNRLIWCGFEFNKKAYFLMAVNETFVKDDLTLSYKTVDYSTGQIEDFDSWNFMMSSIKTNNKNELDELMKARKETIKYIDITEDMIKER